MNTHAGIELISELNRTDADVNMLFLRQDMGAYYAMPVDDPWFEANTPVRRTVILETGQIKTTVYYPKFPISTVACTMQYQWCDAVSSKCTQLTGRMPAMQQATSILFKSGKKRITILRMNQVSTTTGGLSLVGSNLGGLALLMTKHGSYSLAAPRNNEWIQELSHMFGTMLKAMQIRNYRFTGGYTSTLQVQPRIDSLPANATWMCDAQMVRRQDYQSLSVLGITLICTMGALIILINLTLDSIIAWHHKRYSVKLHAIQEWELVRAESLQKQLYCVHGADWSHEKVSVQCILESFEIRGNNRVPFETKQYGKNESIRTLSTATKENRTEVHVRRVSTEENLTYTPFEVGMEIRT